jgi:hypothetical protein
MSGSSTPAALPLEDAPQQGLIDLGRLPDRIRGIAQFWGGATMEARPLYELVRRDGVIKGVDELRQAMTKVHDPKVRAELLDWLGSRLRAGCVR